MSSQHVTLIRAAFGLGGIFIVSMLEQLGLVSTEGAFRDGLLYYLAGGIAGVVIFEAIHRGRTSGKDDS
jgi:hypothetical protein